MDVLQRYRARRNTRLRRRLMRADSKEERIRISGAIKRNKRAMRMDADGTDEEQHWITTENGSHLLVNGKDEVVAGAGGELNGQKLPNAKSSSNSSGNVSSKSSSKPAAKSTTSASKSKAGTAPKAHHMVTANDISKALSLYRNVSGSSHSTGEAISAAFHQLTREREREINIVSNVETMTLDKSAKVVDYKDITAAQKADTDPQVKDMDVGAYAALKGYDAISVIGRKQCPYTVVLNRTKMVMLNKRKRTDAERKGKMTFKPGKNGMVTAYRNGKIIGWLCISTVNKKEK